MFVCRELPTVNRQLSTFVYFPLNFFMISLENKLSAL
jgi:hypothetical protein